MSEHSPSQKGSDGKDRSRFKSTAPILNYEESDSDRTIPPCLLIDDTSAFNQTIFPKNEMARVHTLQSSLLLKDVSIEQDLLVYTSMAARMFKVFF